MLLHHHLPGGVRLRLPHRSDLESVAELCARHGHVGDPAGLLRTDPRRRAVICAAQWTGTGERIVGVGTIALDHRAAPDLVLADDPAVRAQLAAALRSRVALRR